MSGCKNNSDAPEQPASAYRRRFELTPEQSQRLGVAFIADGDDPARPATNQVWLELGAEIGFVWSTVQDVAGAFSASGIAGQRPITFTAEVEDLPLPDLAEASAWLAGNAPPRFDKGPISHPLSGPLFTEAQMLAAWQAGHDAGVIVGEGLAWGRERRPIFEYDDPAGLQEQLETLACAVSIMPGLAGEHAAAMIRLAASRLRELEGEARVNSLSLDLRWKADMRGAEIWRARHPDRDLSLTLPDHGDLVATLLEVVDEGARADTSLPMDELDTMIDRLENARLPVRPSLARAAAAMLDKLQGRAAAMARSIAITDALERARKRGGVQIIWGEPVMGGGGGHAPPGAEEASGDVGEAIYVDGGRRTPDGWHHPDDCECQRCWPLVHPASPAGTSSDKEPGQ